MASEQTRTKRSAASLRTPLIEWRNCEGTLTVGDDSRDVKCRVAVARNGLITVAFKDQRRSAANSRVSIYREAIGHTVPYHRLSVRAPNGDTLTTEHLVITHSGTKSTGRSTVFRLSAQARRLDVTHQPTEEWKSAKQTTTVCYHLLGFRGFQQQIEETDIGRVTVWGASDVDDHDSVAGRLWIERPDDDAGLLDSWLARCDERVRDILLILSLGAGRFVSWVIRELAIGEIRRGLVCNGPRRSGPPFDPLFHRLNLEPAVRLAAKSYSRQLGERTGLRIAIEWFVMSHTYNESRYLASMTALEHLVSKHGDTLGAVLSKKVFDVLRGRLEKTLRSADTRTAIADAFDSEGIPAPEHDAKIDAALNQVSPKLGNLNGLSLNNKFERLLEVYRVRYKEIKPEVRELLAIRNRLTHRGVETSAGNQQSLLVALRALRELLARLFLAMLDYEGPYMSYLNGPAVAHFSRAPIEPSPPPAPAVGEVV